VNGCGLQQDHQSLRELNERIYTYLFSE